MSDTALAEVMAELAALDDPKVREVNARHGDDHGVNLTRLREVAKRLKTQQDLARDLWATGDSAARLLATLICRPKAFERDELDAMLREARTPKERDWLVNYVVKKSPHADGLGGGPDTTCTEHEAHNPGGQYRSKHHALFVHPGTPVAIRVRHNGGSEAKVIHCQLKLAVQDDVATPP
ncbi:DNA alkylation repair protein [Nocardiopsis chromatogenes]|uniref:DNA alkylation repair protein n=1 Tax=Nocardiopsis chromatogenes TaxID=280239 RepID=UPI0003466556|nr:DNA alkylation repair protein [Nocardiopsis chromatogenes]